VTQPDEEKRPAQLEEAQDHEQPHPSTMEPWPEDG
jgi:hypothetical protein